MYPGTIIEWEDRSDIPSLDIASTINKPIQVIAFSSDKGSEDYGYYEGKQFFNQYGNNISFARHGQPLLQAANAINNGAKLFCKRIVAQDSTLANNGVVAYVTADNSQKTDADGNLLYIDSSTGQETTVADGNSPAMVSKCKISYNVVSVDKTESNDLNTVGEKFVAANTDGFPLFILADVGRGVSNKRIQISPDYELSRASEYVKYILTITENNTLLDQMQVTANPDIVELGQNINIQNVVKNRDNSQIRCKFFEDQWYAFIDKVKSILTSESIGMTKEEVDALELEYQDLLIYGKTFKGEELNENILVETNTIITGIAGISLDNGSNGSFGEYPIKAATYAEELAKVFNGEFDDCIYNVDNNPMDVIIDANYPEVVKRAIEDLVEFREDVSYLRDIGNEIDGVRTPCKSIQELKYANQTSAKNRYCSTYATWYDVIDPYTKKQITVTIGYSLARIVTKHFVNGRNRPMCGMKFECTIPEAIEGTLNFAPKITPAGNQKTEMEDLRINYATYLDGVLTIETCYTSQEKYTQLSFNNNVFNCQELIHEIRRKCPRIRYTFLDGDDFETYRKEVNSVLSKYSGNFKSLTMEYQEDSLYTLNKIYYAIIKIVFRDFVQTEKFKLLTINQ